MRLSFCAEEQNCCSRTVLKCSKIVKQDVKTLNLTFHFIKFISLVIQSKFILANKISISNKLREDKFYFL